ncbi:hypothetical protein BKA80DRAFT_49255 [Phyllosticta citrichinensis]
MPCPCHEPTYGHTLLLRTVSTLNTAASCLVPRPRSLVPLMWWFLYCGNQARPVGRLVGGLSRFVSSRLISSHLGGHRQPASAASAAPRVICRAACLPPAHTTHTTRTARTHALHGGRSAQSTVRRVSAALDGRAGGRPACAARSAGFLTRSSPARKGEVRWYDIWAIR